MGTGSAVFKDGERGVKILLCGLLCVFGNIILCFADKGHDFSTLTVRNDKTQVLVGDVSSVPDSGLGGFDVIRPEGADHGKDFISGSGDVVGGIALGNLLTLSGGGTVVPSGDKKADCKADPEIGATETLGEISEKESVNGIHAERPFDGFWFAFGIVLGFLIYKTYRDFTK